MAKKLVASEHAIQCAIVSYLELVLPKSIRVVAISNKPRSAIQGILEKKRGAKKGFPDLMLVGSFVGFFEVKKPGTGRIAPEQAEWADFFVEQDLSYCVVRGVGDVQAALLDWGVIRA